MGERARRVGKNEAVFREVNERIESLNRGIAAISDNKLHVVCECSDLGCAAQIALPVPVYERVRSDATLFIVVPGHEQPDIEDVVEQAADHSIVRKHEGEPARLARATNPRGSDGRS
jgi:hypothetical protein